MVCNDFHLIPPGYFYWKILWKSTKAKKKSAKSANPRVYHWIPYLKINVIYSQTKRGFNGKASGFCGFFFAFVDFQSIFQWKYPGGLKWKLLHIKKTAFYKGISNLLGSFLTFNLQDGVNFFPNFNCSRTLFSMGCPERLKKFSFKVLKNKF